MPEDDKNNVAFYKKRLEEKTSEELSTEVKKTKEKSKAEQSQSAERNNVFVKTEPKEVKDDVAPETKPKPENQTSHGPRLQGKTSNQL